MFMNKKIFTLLTILMCFAFGMSGNAEEKIINAYGGETMFGKVPEYTKWFYFSFVTGEIVGESTFTLKDIEGYVGTEVPSEEWMARDDWDIAFHATDIRTNGLKTVMVADTTSEKPLAEVYAELKNAPVEGFEADGDTAGTFIASMEAMPPNLTRNMSVCKATHGWAALGMGGGKAVMNTKVVVFQLAEDKYVKVYLKEFENEEGDPGYIKLEYAVLDDDGSSNESVEGVKVSVYPNPATDVVNVVMPDAQENTSIGIYSLSGALVKQVNAGAGINTVSVAELSAGMYIVKTNSTAHKILVK
jgi:hypothetical protein